MLLKIFRGQLRQCFDGAARHAFAQVMDSMEERRYQSGDTVIEEGGPGDFFYVTGSGELQVRVYSLI